MRIKLLYLLIITIVSNLKTKAQNLFVGDIAFIGIHENPNDKFTWIALTDIPAGEEIYFTEKGWDGTGSTWFVNTEGHIIYTSPVEGISCGTIVHIEEISTNTFTVTGGGTALITPGTNWSLSGGDQVLAYQSVTEAEPTVPIFIAGVHSDYNAADYNSITKWNNGLSSINGTASMVPLGLTNGVNCVSLYAPTIEFDNNRYTGTLTGTPVELRALINNKANWTAESNTTISIDASQYPIPSIVGCTPLSVQYFDLNNNTNIYPNPSTSYIKITGLDKSKNYTISTVLGAKIQEGIIELNEKINIENLVKGMYFLQIEKEKIFKFIKK